VLEFRGKCLGMDRDDDLPICPECDGEEYVGIIKVAKPIDMEDSGPNAYPRYDQGLGVMLESKAHHRQVMKRMGVEQTHGADLSGAYKDKWAEEDRLMAEFERERDRMENSPDFADFRRLRDRGAYGRNLA
jgi:hypothetical protein